MGKGKVCSVAIEFWYRTYIRPNSLEFFFSFLFFLSLCRFGFYFILFCFFKLREEVGGGGREKKRRKGKGTRHKGDLSYLGTLRACILP